MDIFKLLKIVSTFIVLTMIVSCSSSDGNNTTGATTGRVSILLTDGPTDDFDQVNVTLETISFLSEDDGAENNGVVLFEDTRVINLLALENFSDWLSTTTVPVGAYSKIRLHVSQVELVKLNPDGSVLSSDIAKLPANGKIDLNPKGSFVVIGNGHLILEIDMDAEKSIHIVETGNGKYIFRPVVFVNILGEEELKLVLLEGKVLARTETSFQLCDVEVLVVDDSCRTVSTADNTVVHDESIDVVTIESIEDNDIVTVLAKASSESIKALHVVITTDDEPQDITLFSGEATSMVDVENSFSMTTDDTNEVVPALTSLDIRLSDGARVFDEHGAIVASDIIVSGSDIDVFGLAMPNINTITEVKAAFVIVGDDNNDKNITGEIVAIDEAESQITVSVVDGDFSGDVCVDTSDAVMLLLTQDEDKITSDAIVFNDLQIGMLADIYGEEDDSACLDANVILLSFSSEVGL